MKLPPVLVYSVLRLLAFVVPFAVLMLFPVFQQLYWLAAIFAALIGLSISVLFLRRPLAAVSQQAERRRAERAAARTVRDEDVEDAAAEGRSRDASADASTDASASASPDR